MILDLFYNKMSRRELFVHKKKLEWSGIDLKMLQKSNRLSKNHLWSNFRHFNVGHGLHPSRCLLNPFQILKRMKFLLTSFFNANYSMSKRLRLHKMLLSGVKVQQVHSSKKYANNIQFSYIKDDS